MPLQDENRSPTVLGRRPHEGESALQLGPRKKPVISDPLVHHGRHFGRTVHALCRVHTLLSNGIVLDNEFNDDLAMTEESLSPTQRREYRVYKKLLQVCPALEERIINGSEEDLVHFADLIQKGSASARSDDTKSLKGAILDWITPRGGSLNPPIARNVKADRGFHHETTGALLCPTDLNWSDNNVKEKLRSGELQTTGDQWPIFLYHGYTYDEQDPWNGLFRSALLVTAYKHIFTSPSSVDKEPKATRSGNARIHGMTCVTGPSIAYVATQVRFALSSSPIFSRSDLATDSERFYNTILDLFEDDEEEEEVNDLFAWWNRQVFPTYSTRNRLPAVNNVLAKIKAKRIAMRNLDQNSAGGD